MMMDLSQACATTIYTTVLQADHDRMFRRIQNDQRILRLGRCDATLLGNGYRMMPELLRRPLRLHAILGLALSS